ncbi:MAG TPA: serine hydrolase domain-containing protein [Dongiaceae bacterium]|nr:serine hydrolase domain-containing protein [Dongiaceae bacterium]
MRKQSFLAALALLFAHFCFAQAPAPPAAEQLTKDWLAAFNSGDKPTLQSFLEKYRPSDVAHVDGLLDFHSRTGGFDFEKLEESTPTHCSALLKEKNSDQFARMVIDVEPDPPHKITKFEMNAIPRPPEFAIPRMSQKDTIDALGKQLEVDAAADRFAGTALLARNGSILFQHAYGLSDRERKTPNQLNTQFRIGSMNKMFTAVCVMQLVQAGKIQLSDPFGKYLTDYANKDMASKVTIQQLLTHTGGTGDFFGPEFDKHRLELKTLQDYVKLYENRSLAFEPGSRFEYSNFGFLLLGVVVEKVTGQSYYEYVREHVYQPAGMTSTDSLPESESVSMRSIGYMRERPGPVTDNKDTLPYRGTSAGGGYSTAEDLYKFATALENHKLLDAAHTDMLVTGKVDTGRGPDKYAFGFFNTNEGGLECFGHGGGAPGMNGDLKICPKSGYIIAVLANLDPPAAQRVSNFAANRLPLH